MKWPITKKRNGLPMPEGVLARANIESLKYKVAISIGSFGQLESNFLESAICERKSSQRGAIKSKVAPKRKAIRRSAPQALAKALGSEIRTGCVVFASCAPEASQAEITVTTAAATAKKAVRAARLTKLPPVC